MSLVRHYSICLNLHQHLGVDRLAAQQRVRWADIGEEAGMGASDCLGIFEVADKDTRPDDIGQRRTGLAQDRLDLAEDAARSRGGVVRSNLGSWI